jgi:hypothetical protein
MGTGLVAGTLATLGSCSLTFGAGILGLGVLVGALAGVFFDRVARHRDPAVFPVAFGVLGGLSGSLLLLLTLSPTYFTSWLPAGTAFWTFLISTGFGGLAGALIGGSAGVFAGRRDPEDPLPAAARAAVVAGLGTLGFAKVGALGVFLSLSGPLSAAIATVGFGLDLVGAWTLGAVAAIAAGAGTLLAAGRQAWVEQDLPPAPVLSGDLLHESSEGYRALLVGDDPTIH